MKFPGIGFGKSGHVGLIMCECLYYGQKGVLVPPPQTTKINKNILKLNKNNTKSVNGQ